MAATLHPDRALEDIRDVEAFSATVVRRSLAKRMLPEEIEEAIAEGVLLLFELHLKWDRVKTPSFATWCGTMLQLRLTSWWRREMRQRNLAHRVRSSAASTGSDAQVYLGRVSLDSRVADPMNEDQALISFDTGRVGE